MSYRRRVHLLTYISRPHMPRWARAWVAVQAACGRTDHWYDAGNKRYDDRALLMSRDTNAVNCLNCATFMGRKDQK